MEVNGIKFVVLKVLKSNYYANPDNPHVWPGKDVLLLCVIWVS